MQMRSVDILPAPSVVQPPATIPSRRRVGQLMLRGVNKTFTGSTVHALQDINLTCEPGEFVVVVGPSGCGKSTLLNIAAGMVRPDRGEALLDGHAIQGPGPD